MSRVDELLQFDILRTELQALADEMAIKLMRGSFSPVIRDFLDFSTALTDADGYVIAQGFSLPLHLGAIPRAMEAVRARYDESELVEGDVVVLNDPYSGGMHLPDIFMVAPAHFDGHICGYAVVVAHHIDIGGRVAGGSGADSREIFEEGLRIPPIRLWAAGHLDENVGELVRANVRLPDILWRDILAQFSASLTGIDGLRKLGLRYGPMGFGERCRQILNHSRSGLRAELAGWPTGSYEFEDYEDHDGIGEERVPIRVRVTVGDGSVAFNFEGSGEQVQGSINCTRSFTESACYAAVRALCVAEVAVNQGFVDLITVEVPERTVVNVAFPGGVAARGVIGYRIIEAIFGALSNVLPDRVPAAGDGGTTGIRISGVRDDGRRFQFNDIVCGSWGARPGRDGMEGAAGIASNISNRPIESAEREDPVRIHSYGFVADTGGAGRYRGGLAIKRVIELLAPSATLNLRSHRSMTPPYGLHGGHEGTLSSTYLVRDGDRVLLAAKGSTQLRRGDVIEHQTAAGGGIGSPVMRDWSSLTADLREGKLTAQHIDREYGRDPGKDQKDGQ